MTNLDCSLRSRSIKLCARGVSAICVSFFITVTTGQIPRGGQSPARDGVIGRNYGHHKCSRVYARPASAELPEDVSLPFFLYDFGVRLESFVEWRAVMTRWPVGGSVATPSVTVSALLSQWWLFEWWVIISLVAHSAFAGNNDIFRKASGCIVELNWI